MPMITSLLDMDFYKFTMGQEVFRRHRNVHVQYALKCRTKGVRLAEVIDLKDLRALLDHVRTLRFNKSELHYLRGTNEYGERMFREDYLEFLGQLQLPPYHLSAHDGDIVLTFEGAWAEAMYWETIALSLVNELYYRARMEHMSPFEKDTVRAQGILRLQEKIRLLRMHPDITIVEFGTRRRFSQEWQDYVTGTLARELPKQFLGTSNTALALKYALLPMGTSAHEMFMVYAAIASGDDAAIRASHNQALKDWWETYGLGLSIALPDTYGTEFFFRDMTKEQALAWKGVRQDSGDPFAFGERAIQFYESHGINPREKLIIFSDGLDVETIIRLADRFCGRIKVTFGWGTNLTNDLGFPSLSLVIKVVEANGHGTVKLSDNLAKAMGAYEDVERYKRIFGHTVTAQEECRY